MKKVEEGLCIPVCPDRSQIVLCGYVLECLARERARLPRKEMRCFQMNKLVLDFSNVLDSTGAVPYGSSRGLWGPPQSSRVEKVGEIKYKCFRLKLNIVYREPGDRGAGLVESIVLKHYLKVALVDLDSRPKGNDEK